MALSAQVWPPAPACTDRAVSPTVETAELNTASTRSVAAAVTASVRFAVAVGSVIEPTGPYQTTVQ
jgi:hypothetical protein